MSYTPSPTAPGYVPGIPSGPAATDPYEGSALLLRGDLTSSPITYTATADTSVDNIVLTSASPASVNLKLDNVNIYNGEVVGTVNLRGKQALSNGKVITALATTPGASIHVSGDNVVDPGSTKSLYRGSVPAVGPISDFTQRTLPVSAQWFSVTYGNGTFVAVAGGVTNTFSVTSSDGITWTQRTMPVTAIWQATTYGNGMFVAVSSTTVAASSPDGITWTQRAVPSANWQAVTYGNGTFVAVAGSVASTVAATSPDGITWTARTLPASVAWKSVTYGNGTFVAINNNTTAATSPDGITWTARVIPSASWTSVTYGNGTFVAVANNSTIAATSPDGRTWTQQVLPTTANWNAVTYGSGTFVAVASGPSTIAATSPDGITWAQIAMPISANWRSVTSGGGTFVSLAQSTVTAATTFGNINNNTLYTAPTKAVIESVTLQGSGAGFLQLGGTDILYDRPVSGTSTYNLEQVLNQGETITGSAAGTVVVHINGVELT